MEDAREQLATALGAKAYHIEKPGELAATLAKAISLLDEAGAGAVITAVAVAKVHPRRFARADFAIATAKMTPKMKAPIKPPKMRSAIATASMKNDVETKIFKNASPIATNEGNK